MRHSCGATSTSRPDARSAATDALRPTVALVLGGVGLRGFAHMGGNGSRALDLGKQARRQVQRLSRTGVGARRWPAHSIVKAHLASVLRTMALDGRGMRGCRTP